MIEDDRAKAAQARPKIPTERGGGSGGDPIEIAYQKALRGEGPMPSAADIDKITAKYA